MMIHSQLNDRSGFTLIELMVVIVILSFIAGWAMIDYSGTTERQKLSTTVRRFVGMYRETRARAIKERRYCVLQLDIENQAYRVLVYPHQDQSGRYVNFDGDPLDPEFVEEMIEFRKWTDLEKGVFLTDVEAPGPDGNEQFDIDFYVEFRDDGTVPPHILHFATQGGLEMSVEVEEITGNVTIFEGLKEFYSPQPEEFDALSGDSTVAR